MTPRHAAIFSAFLDSTLGRGIGYWWRPRGYSMEPAIRDGERVLVGPAVPHGLRVGDVVKYRVGDELRMHRLVEILAGDGGPRFVLRGDTGDLQDTVAPGDVIGRALAVERDGKPVALDPVPVRRPRRLWGR